MKTTSAEVELDTPPRDRKGTIEPQLVQKHQSFDSDLEARVFSMYASGISTHYISQQLQEFYATAFSAALISKITDTLLEMITA